MRNVIFLLLLITACKFKELEPHDKLVIANESNAGARHTHLECAGKRIATDIRSPAVSTNYISYDDGKTLFLADTSDCSITALFSDPRLHVDPVEWNASGKYGFKQVLGHVGDSGVIDGTSGASASFIIHATRPPKMEPLDGHAWLPVGSSLFGEPAWSGDVLLLARHLPERGYEVATWSPGTGLHVFAFKSPDGQRFPTHAWKGTTPLIKTPEGFVELH